MTKVHDEEDARLRGEDLMEIDGVGMVEVEEGKDLKPEIGDEAVSKNVGFGDGLDGDALASGEVAGVVDMELLSLLLLLVSSNFLPFFHRISNHILLQQ